MNYYEVKFKINASDDLLQTARELTSALAGEAGFESFEDSDEGLNGYVQQQLFDEPLLEQLLADFPLPHCTVTFSVEEADNRDWNEQWENEGFQPIVVDSRCVVHDGCHLPTASFPISIEIDAHLAFGTGTHQTTRLMLNALLGIDLSGCQVIDCGTGTGILAIAALKHGAAKAVGYDIDEWSVENARHNAIINQVDDRFTSLLGDATLLDNTTPIQGTGTLPHTAISGSFQLVMANINRNILLADLPRFHQVMAPGAHLLLSGFYTADAPLLIDAARQQGLTFLSQQQEDEWACLTFVN